MVQRGAVVSKKGSTWRAGVNTSVNRASEVAVAANTRGQPDAWSGFAGRGWPNRRLWSFADGFRGVQAANLCSEGFSVFMIDSFEARPQSSKSISVTTGDGIWGKLEQQADLLESVTMPDLEDDDLALFLRE